MKIITKFQDDPDMIHAVIRMSAKEYKALHEYMHCEAGDAIRFPYGAYITVRGRGWYRLIVGNDVRTIDKIKFAVKTIQRFLNDEEAKIEEELKHLAPLMMDNTLRVTSFSNAQSITGDWGYTGQPMPPADQRPAPVDRLRALANKFNSASNARREVSK